jgi:hypothetical protein
VRLGGEEPLLLRDVLLEDVGLQRAVERADVHALAFGGDQVHAEDRDGGAADGHRRRGVAERDLVEEHVHVGGGVDRDAAVTDLAEGPRVVGVQAHEGGHVEGDRQAAAALGQDHPVTLVGLLGVAEAGELPDGPRPAAVAGGVQAAGEGELTRIADPLEVRDCRLVGRAVDRLHLDAGQRGEVGVAHLAGGQCRVVPLLPPLPCVVDHAEIVGRPTIFRR